MMPSPPRDYIRTRPVVVRRVLAEERRRRRRAKGIRGKLTFDLRKEKREKENQSTDV